MAHAPSETEMLLALREVIDPELGVNIVDLGLVYEAGCDDAGIARVRMTMTTPACPMGPYLTEEVQRVLNGWFPTAVNQVEVELTFEPPWKPDRMTAEAREQLGWAPED